MIQQIDVNIQKVFRGVSLPQYYNTTVVSTPQSTFTPSTNFQSGSTIVFVNSGSGFVYQGWGLAYTENSNTSITFGTPVSVGSIVEIRYNQLISY